MLQGQLHALRDRVASVDALRGLAVLVLVPNLGAGFSFNEVARQHTGDSTWAALARLFTHAPWQGLTVWDMVMPIFVFVMGISMAFSVHARREAGASSASLWAHAVMRSATLVVLGMLLPLRRDNLAQELLPYLVLATGLPWSRWFTRWTGVKSRARDGVLETGIPALIVALTAAWLAHDVERLGAYDFAHIFTQLGFAYLPAFLLVGRGTLAPALTAAAILVLWGLLFMAFPIPAGAEVIGPAMNGLLAHWNNGTNLAAAFDRWLFSALPRSVPYVNARGDHTLEFVPMVASTLIGVAIGRVILRRPANLPLRVAATGAAALLVGLLLVWLGVFPLVKNLWTPSWALVSSGICLVVLAALMALLDAPQRAWLGYPLAVLGTNAVLLYVISTVDRWRVILYGERVLGDIVIHSDIRPLLQSIMTLAVLWGLAFALARLRVHVRL